MKKLKYSTQITLKTLMVFGLALFFSCTVKNYVCLAFAPDKPAIISIICGFIAGLYVMLSLAAFKAVFKVVKLRIYEHKQGWLEDPILINHGSTLQEVIQGLRSEPFECLAYFSPSGEKLVEATMNRPSQVALSHKQHQLVMQYPGCISVHNHPGEIIEAFSSNDLKTSLTRHESRAIVVAQDLCFIIDFPDGIEARSDEIVNFMEKFPMSLIGTGIPRVNIEANVGIFKYLQNGNIDDLNIMRCCMASSLFGFSFSVKPTDEMVASKEIFAN